MIASKAGEPELHVPLDELHHQPEANAKATEYFGEAPVRRRRVASRRTRTTARRSTRRTRSTSPRVYYWKTPVADCGDDRGEVCKDYSEWTRPGRRSGASAPLAKRPRGGGRPSGRPTSDHVSPPVQSAAPAPGPGRRLSTFLYRHPGSGSAGSSPAPSAGSWSRISGRSRSCSCRRSGRSTRSPRRSSASRP